MKKSCIFFAIILFCSCMGNAQSPIKDSTNTGIFGIYGVVNSPVSQFGQAGYWGGGGIEVNMFSRNLLTTPVKGFNLRLGGSFTYSGQGGVKNNVLLHDPLNAPGTQALHNNFWGMDVKAKVIYDQNTVRPYADLFWGYRDFSSSQVLTINHPMAGYQATTRTNVFSTAVVTYGASLGCLIKLNDNVFLDLKSTYTTSNNPIAFVNFNHLVSDGKMYVPTGSSAIPSMLSFQAGIVFKIDKGTSRSSWRSSNSGYSGYSYSPVYHYSGCNYHSYSSRSSSRGSCGGGAKPLR